MNLRCLAIDDEPFALEMMVDNISRIPFLDGVGAFTNPLEAMSVIDTGQVDLVFLDIQMPTLTGIQFLRSLRNPPMIILTTAYEQYALDGFDLNVVDYLLKPIPFERFLRAANKANELFQLRNRTDSSPAQPIEPEFIVVFSEYKQIRISLDEILYVEGLKDYVKIYLQGRQWPILTRMSLRLIESRLASAQFCRVHHSYIVALSKISSFQKARLMIGNQSIPVGSRFAEAFERQYIP